MLEKLTLFDLVGQVIIVIDTETDLSVFDKRSSFKMLQLEWGSYIISIGKIASRKTGALFRYMSFLFFEIAFYLYKNTLWSFMEYCCLV